MVSFKLFQSAARKYREEGFRAFLESTHNYVRWQLAKKGLIQGVPYHQRKRTDSEDRWKLIVSQLDSDDTTALDIGCASGFFSAKLAESGRFTIGVDIEAHRLESARREWKGLEQVAFMQYQVTPDSISRLPNFDVVLLLTVYHHWVNAFGRKAAESMLQGVAGNTNKIILEPPGEAYHKFSTIGDREIGDHETASEYYTNLLQSIFDESVNITHLGDAEYPSHDERTDPLFLLECKDYNV